MNITPNGLVQAWRRFRTVLVLRMSREINFQIFQVWICCARNKHPYNVRACHTLNQNINFLRQIFEKDAPNESVPFTVHVNSVEWMWWVSFDEGVHVHGREEWWQHGGSGKWIWGIRGIDCYTNFPNWRGTNRSVSSTVDNNFWMDEKVDKMYMASVCRTNSVGIVQIQIWKITKAQFPRSYVVNKYVEAVLRSFFNSNANQKLQFRYELNAKLLLWEYCALTMGGVYVPGLAHMTGQYAGSVTRLSARCSIRLTSIYYAYHFKFLCLVCQSGHIQIEIHRWISLKHFSKE